MKGAIKSYESTEIDGKKPNFDGDNIDEDVFKRIMEGNSVCVWGQCYYSSAKKD